MKTFREKSFILFIVIGISLSNVFATLADEEKLKKNYEPKSEPVKHTLEVEDDRKSKPSSSSARQIPGNPQISITESVREIVREIPIEKRRVFLENVLKIQDGSTPENKAKRSSQIAELVKATFGDSKEPKFIAEMKKVSEVLDEIAETKKFSQFIQQLDNETKVALEKEPQKPPQPGAGATDPKAEAQKQAELQAALQRAFLEGAQRGAAGNGAGGGGGGSSSKGSSNKGPEIPQFENNNQPEGLKETLNRFRNDLNKDNRNINDTRNLLNSNFGNSSQEQKRDGEKEKKNDFNFDVSPKTPKAETKPVETPKDSASAGAEESAGSLLGNLAKKFAFLSGPTSVPNQAPSQDPGGDPNAGDSGESGGSPSIKSSGNKSGGEDFLGGGDPMIGVGEPNYPEKEPGPRRIAFGDALSGGEGSDTIESPVNSDTKYRRATLLDELVFTAGNSAVAGNGLMAFVGQAQGICKGVDSKWIWICQLFKRF